MNKLFAISIASLALAAPTAAFAEAGEIGQAVEIRINVSDLDLSDPAHYDVMKQRVKKTVRAACVREPATRFQPKSTDWTCVRTATAAALAQVETKKARQLALNTN